MGSEHGFGLMHPFTVAGSGQYGHHSQFGTLVTKSYDYHLRLHGLMIDHGLALLSM